MSLIKTTIVTNMKFKAILTFLCVFSVISGWSQNNLLFNQAAIIDIPLGGSVSVPTGKVWKIENFGMSSSRTRYTPSLIIDGQEFNVVENFNGPIWLSENSVVERGVDVGSTVSGVQKLNILEFNVSSSGGGSGSSGGNIGAEGLAIIGVLFEQFGPFTPNTFQVLGEIIVPANTVYKITSISLSNGNGLAPSGHLLFNNHAIFTATGNNSTGENYLGPGTYEVKLRESSDANFATINGLIYTF